jgi:hypothetical protein
MNKQLEKRIQEQKEFLRGFLDRIGVKYNGDFALISHN